MVKVESYSRNMKARDHRETKVQEEYKSDQVSQQFVIQPCCSTAPPRACSPWPSDSRPSSPGPPSPPASSPGWPPARALQLRCPIAPLIARTKLVSSDLVTCSGAWVRVHVVQERGVVSGESSGAPTPRVRVVTVREVTATCPHVRLVWAAPSNCKI